MITRHPRFLRLIASAIAILISGTVAVAAAPPVQVDIADLYIDGDLGPFKASWTSESPSPNVTLATLTLEAPQPTVPPKFEVKWKIPSVEIAGLWVSDHAKHKHDFERIKVESRAVQRAPLIMYLDTSDHNRFTVALSDTMRPAMLAGGIKEEDAMIYMRLGLFQERQPATKSFQVTLRFDTRPLPYESVLRDTSRWWAAQPGYTPAPVPEAARLPVYSTWYSYHQHLDPDQIVRECELGGKLGLHGVIVDDGWQTLDNNRGYAFTGDWQPDRIPEMKAFVDRIHALNQKAWLWYSVPMVGEHSEAAKRFKGKTLSFGSGTRAYTLDPRYPEVREYLISLYDGAVRDWGYDGLKLDFLEMFSTKPDTILTAEDGRDIASVDEAVDRLLTDVMAHLRTIRPDIAIEFRQPYNGPLMRKYGNMLRAVDCPNIGPVNRRHIVDLRLLADTTAVHSDMLMWHPDESVESAAMQVLNILFSVPQISVRLADVSPPHQQMIGFWMDYWMKNRAVLLDGQFRAVSPPQNYPLVSGRTAEKLITALYQDMVVDPGADAPVAIDIVNAKPSTTVVVNYAKAYGKASIRCLDTRGQVVSEQTQTLAAGTSSWQVPPSGLLEIRRVNTASN